MIGLGVGIDYALFILNRFRQAVMAGHAPKDAALESVNTAGRAVQFAGTTVIIALLGLFVLGIGFFNGLAVAASPDGGDGHAVGSVAASGTSVLAG